MKNQTRGTIAEAEIAREAKRIFRYLAESSAMLASVNADWFALHHGARQERRVQKVSAQMVERFFRNGWIARGERTGTLVLSNAGRGWLVRAECANGDPFMVQHQVLTTRTIKNERGRPEEIQANVAEDPLGWLLYRHVINRTQYDAGEKLRRDFTFAKIAPPLGMNLETPMVTKSRTVESLPDVAIAAGQRFRAALRAVGPGLADLVFDVCCDLKGLEDVEKRRDWPRRSAKVVLGLALDRLAEYYGIAMTAPDRGAMRSWLVEEGEGS